MVEVDSDADDLWDFSTPGGAQPIPHSDNGRGTALTLTCAPTTAVKASWSEHPSLPRSILDHRKQADEDRSHALSLYQCLKPTLG